MLGIRLAATTAYHPQGDSQTEQVNQELEQYLWIFVNQWQDNWTNLLPLAKFQYNNHVLSLTQHPLFLLETGQLLCMGFEPDQCPSCIESINKFTDQMKNTLEKAKAALSKSKDQRYYNQRQFAAPKYQPGDKVYIDVSDIQTTQTPKKLSHKCLGPFLIERQVGNSAYHLNLPASMSRLQCSQVNPSHGRPYPQKCHVTFSPCLTPVFCCSDQSRPFPLSSTNSQSGPWHLWT